MYQVFNQNTPSLLGMAFALLLAATLPTALAAGGRMIPMAAIALAALVGTYPELAGGARPRSGRPGCAAVQTLADRCRPEFSGAGARCRDRSAHLGPGVPVTTGRRRCWWPTGSIERHRGGLRCGQDIRRHSVPGCAARYVFQHPGGIDRADRGLCGGGGSGLRAFAHRRSLACVSATVVGLACLLTEAEPAKGYTLGRLMAFCFPLVLTGAALGLGAFASWVDNRRTPHGSWLGAWAVAVVVVMAISVTTTLDYLGGVRSDIREVDSSYSQADGWLDEIGDPTGDQVSIAAFDFVNQLWISEATREREGVAYPVLDPSYFRMPHSWDGSGDRYLLIDTSGLWSALPQAVVRQNERFSLLDTSVGVAALSSTGDHIRFGVAAESGLGDSPNRHGLDAGHLDARCGQRLRTTAGRW